MSRTAQEVRQAVQKLIDQDYNTVLHQIEQAIDAAINDKKTSFFVYPKVAISEHLKYRILNELKARNFAVIYSPEKGYPEETQASFLISC